MHILQIDDSKAICQLYHDLFTSRGYKFESTTDGKEGLELARKYNYDVILLDMLMPKYGGMQFLEELKNTKPSELRKKMIVSQMEYSDDDIKKLSEFGIHSVQKKSIKHTKNLIDYVGNIGHMNQNKKESEGLKAKEIDEPRMELEEIKDEMIKKQNDSKPRMELEEMEYEMIKKQDDNEPRMELKKPSEKTIKKMGELKFQLKQNKNQITKLNQELRAARILKKYTLEQLKELQNEIAHNYEHQKELESIPEIKIRTSAYQTLVNRYNFLNT